MIVALSDFAPAKTQISSPGGLRVNLAKITAIESYEASADPHMIVHLEGTSVTVRFHLNTDGGRPQVFLFAANIAAAANGSRGQ